MNYFLDFIKGVVPNNGTYLMITVIIVLLFWMYKELRANYLESIKLDQQRFEKALEIYTEAEIEVYKYVQRKTDFYDAVEKISKATVLFPNRLVETFNRLREEDNQIDQRAGMMSFRKELQKEISFLKSEQVNPLITSDSSGDLVVTIESFFKSKIAPFAIPLFHAYLNFILLILVLYFILSLISASTAIEGISIFLLSFDLYSYVIILFAIISEGFIKKRFIHKIYNWTFLIIFLFIPIVFLFNRDWYVGLVIFLLFTFYIGYFRKKSLKNP
ncbi:MULTISPECIES: hypothetical protein [Paenibacillus]|uniref:hypothetical protein n=1 Tax=Paenibacillus TaxID=44249 RepID=UPI000B844B31|nr:MULTISPECIES: hypothetical protein [Paenibacillus]PRA03859.1 hypothetical protein CQ043_20365 [Paenibacillus sp. MYb63]PRA44678.1 hypothetical protein CQ061_24645 [Paenibacillus sp. MYb67]QZN77026.1 hypothetical protein K5K90_07230 [Paenibacillus sp. DR312]